LFACITQASFESPASKSHFPAATLCSSSSFSLLAPAYASTIVSLALTLAATIFLFDLASASAAASADFADGGRAENGAGLDLQASFRGPPSTRE
jgi:hypothetical protein